jgi:uncharacterized protein (TIGR02996 family)
MQPDVPILTPELGINVNDRHQAFTDQILSGAKTIETRSAPTLHPYIGKKMGLVRTGKGKAMLVGYVTIGEPKLYTAESSFDSDFDSHLVGKDSPFHISKSKKGSKWGYTLSDVEKVEPRLLKDGTGVAPNPRVARRLQKIADHVRVKLARTPSQPMTAESFGSLWHMARTPNAHLEKISGGTIPFIHPDPSSGVWKTESAEQVRNSPSAVHFVAHHPDQFNPQIIEPESPNEPFVDVHTHRGTDNPFFDSIARSSSEFGASIDDLEQRRGLSPGSMNKAERNRAIDDIVSGQGRIRRMVGLPQRSDGAEPTVYFKSHRAAKLAAVLTGGHVESVSFEPKLVAKGAINTLKNGPYSRIYLPTFFDIRNGVNDASFSECLLPNPDPEAGEFYRGAPHVLAKHPVFGEYMTNVGERNPANVGRYNPAYYGFIYKYSSHRSVQLRQNNWRPDGDTIASYGNPPLHFTPEILDDVGRELHAQVVANPGDHLARAVLADHLDNMGHHEHADNWRQTLPLKFRKSGAPVRYSAEQDDVPSSTLPSSNPASTSFGSTKDWLVKNDPHPMWLNGRRTSEVAATNVGPVRHLSHDDSQLSAVHFVAGHPAQMSPISTFDLNFPAQGIKVLGIRNPERGLRGPEASSYLPEHNVSYNFGGEPSQEFTRDSERDFLDRVRGGAMQVNREILDELGVKGATTVNGIDVQDAFTPLFKDRDAAERMANSVGGYVHTIHIDPSRLRGRKSPLGSQTYGGTVYPELLSNDRFQLIDNRASGTPPTNLRQSVITLSKHPEHGEYILAHNMRHLTKDTFSQRSNHFSGSLSKAERFGVNSGGVPSRNSAYSGWWADQARKSHIVPLISQYWRNLIDLHSEHHNDPWNEDYNLPMVLSADGIGGDYTPPTRQLINSMGDAAQHLYAMALADRNDHLPRMVLADMFDEHGHDGAANFMRASIPHHVRRQLKLAKNGDVFHTLVWHNSETDEPISQFDASKASKTALLGPAFYFSKQPKRWNLPGSKGIDRPYLVGGNLIDLSKPLEPEHAQAIASVLGRNSEAPLLALEHKFGSVSKGLEAAGFDGAWHLGPSGKTNVIDLAMFKPHLIKPAPQSDDGQSGRVKLAKGEKPDANWQPKPGADVEVHSDESGGYPTSGFYKGPSSIPGKHIVVKQNDDGDIRKSKVPEHQIYAPGGFAHMGPSVAQQQISPETAQDQPAQQPQQPSFQRGDSITFRQYNNRIYEATYGRRLNEGESGMPGSDWHEVHKKGEGDSPTWIQGRDINPQQSAAPQQSQRSKDFSDNPPEAGDVIRIDSSLSGDRFHNGTYRVTPDHRGEIWHTNGREIRVEPVGNSPVNPSGFIPVRGRNYFMVNQAERQAPEPAEKQQQQQPELIAPLRHPEIGPRMSFIDNAHKLATGDIIHTYFRYVDEDGEQHYRLLHSQPRMFVDIDDDRGTFRSHRINDDGTASPAHFSAPSAWNGSELPMFSLVQRAAETYRRVNSGLPELAEPGASPAPAAPYLTPEQIADAHFNVGEDVHVRDENGSTDVGTYSRIHLTPSGEIQHIVSLSGNLGEAAFNPENVWHWYGASSRHKAFRSPESQTQVNDRLQSVSPGRRVWVDVVGTGSLSSHRRATLVGVNPDATISVRLDGKTDPIKVPLSRVKDNSDQSPPHVDMFDGSPISIIDAANGEVHHGVYRGPVRPNRNGQSVHDAILSAGLPYGENWTDPNRRPEDFVHVVEIRTPQGPLPVAVERRDLLPRFAQGVTHNEANEDPRSGANTLMKVASAFEPTAPDEAARFRERAAELLTRPVRTINRPVVGGPALTTSQHTRSRSASPLSGGSAAPANAPPIDKKLERMIFNAGERNYDDVAESLRDKFSEMFGEEIDDQTIMDILRVPRAFPGSDPNHPAFSPENLSLDLGIYSDSVSSTVRSKLPNYKFHANTGVGPGDVSNQSQGHSGMKGTHDKFISTPHILQNQANAAHRLGINKLKVNAALTNPVIDPHNGYTGGIVWPTYGYTKDLERINDWDDVQLAEAIAIARRNNPDLHAIDDSELTLNHLLDSKEGIDWYTENEPHRHGGKHYLNATSGHMVFHTDPNSISHRILARKVRRLEQNAASRSSPS